MRDEERKKGADYKGYGKRGEEEKRRREGENMRIEESRAFWSLSEVNTKHTHSGAIVL